MATTKRRAWIKIMFYLLLLLAVALALAFLFGPREPADLTVRFDAEEIGSEVDTWIAGREAQVSGLRDNASKEIVWAYPASKAKTPVAIAYLHGYSAAKGEIRPVPDAVAAELGANLFYTRLTGHGRDGDAMAEATVNDWIQDAAEAIAVADRIGEKVVLVSTSTGASLAAVAASLPELRDRIDGIVLVSPNFGVRASGAWMLTMPFAETLVPLIVGPERAFEPQNERHAANWTFRYPSVALLPMAALVKTAAALPFEQIDVPALFVYHPDDQVVDQSITARVAERWGGPVETLVVDSADDPSNHVIAGDIMSPSNNDAAAVAIAGFIRGL